MENTIIRFFLSLIFIFGFVSFHSAMHKMHNNRIINYMIPFHCCMTAQCNENKLKKKNPVAFTKSILLSTDYIISILKRCRGYMKFG